MITLTRLAKRFGARTLFENASLLLQAGHRYGLVGANGAGKTTLLRILEGNEEASDGSVSIHKGARLGVLRQDRFLNDDETILHVAMEGDAEALDALRAIDAAYEAGDAERVAALEDTLARTDGRTLKSRAGAVLEGLGIRTAKHADKLGTLSGGYKLRVLLAQVLVARPDVLLLDEPTNHLDILSIRWLEKFLQSYQGCAVVISHDARFLEQVATDTLDVDYGTVTLYPYGWKKFLEEKALRRAQKEAEIAGVEEEIERKRAFVERFGAKATKAAQAQSRMKQIARLEEDLDELPPSSRRAPYFHFPIVRESGKDVLTIEHVDKAYGPLRVLADVSIAIKKNERVAIIGENGVGKSTLLKIAVGQLAPDAGALRWGHETRPGYFAQDHKDVIDEDDTPYTYLSRFTGDRGVAFTRKMLGRVLLSGEDADKRCGALSGGEAARLVFARLMVEQPNVLVLDEPTNHLDLESIDALVEALIAYPGTLVFVSHDRAFVSALATRVVEIRREGLNDFLGTYEEYLAACGDDHLDSDAVAHKDRSERRAQAPASDGAQSWEDKKKQKNQRAQWTKRRDDVVKLLEAAEADKAAIHARWADPAFFTSAPREEQEALTEKEKALASSIDAWMAEWEDLEQKLASSA